MLAFDSRLEEDDMPRISALDQPTGWIRPDPATATL
jgi:hypothetical protein